MSFKPGISKVRTVAILLAIACLLMGERVANSPVWAAAPEKGPPSSELAKIPFPKPRSHSANWAEYHGREVEPVLNGATESSTTCATCHERTDCIACHAARAPRDHNGAWRNLSHGFMAEGNPDRCKICHKQDFCVRCHNETKPRSHTGGWTGGLRPRHCTWCHFGSGISPADTCVVCHRRAPHTSAPHTVNGQMNCTLCHR